MAFKAVQLRRYSWRVLDEERGIELKSVGGSSDGIRYFRLLSGVDEVDLAGRFSTEAIHKDGDETDGYWLKWRLMAPDTAFRYGPHKSDVAPVRQLLTEAFEQHYAWGQPMKGYVGRVEFGNI